MNSLQIKKELFKIQDIKYKKFHSSLCPGINNIIGVRIPALRKYAKELSKDKNFTEYIKYNTEYYEETMLQGMFIGFIKNDINKVLKLLEQFIPRIDNWAVCDITAAGLKIINEYKKEVWNFILKYVKSKKEFDIRFTVVVMMSYFIDEQYITQVLSILNSINHDGYYVKMAVAWAISTAFIKQPEITMNFLKNCKLDKWTYNKTLQKITESYRVNTQTKEIIKKMKKL